MSLRKGNPPLGVSTCGYIWSIPMVDGLRRLADLVSLVHLSDTTRNVWRHDEVGRGDVPFAEVRAALGDIDFDGTCVLEIVEPHPEAAILRSHQALTFLGFASRPEEAMA